MGKRSEFERVEKDFYRTIDKRAVDILQPFLIEIEEGFLLSEGHSRSSLSYAEPCVGTGDLLAQLKGHGHDCRWSSDITYGQDALELTSDHLTNCDLIITNPPWSRPILHPMIEHFAKLKPTWLLFDADWAHTKQSSRYMKDYCTHIVSVGRLIWIEGTKTSGKDNCAWYRFDTNKEKDTIFYGR
jgi:hypothetical protein